MIIVCPTCSTRYTVSDDSVPLDGRKVRCIKCGNSWHQFPVAEAAPPPSFDPAQDDAATQIWTPPPEIPLSAPSPLPTSVTPPPTHRRFSRILGWGLLVGIVGGLAAGLFFAEDMVVRTFPGAVALYGALGLPPEPPGSGLALAQPQITVTARTQEALSIVVEGRITNSGESERAVPHLQAISTNAMGAELDHWAIEPSSATLSPGQVATYRSEHAVAPTVKQITIRFE